MSGNQDNSQVRASQTVCISNDLYEFDILSAFEMAKVLTNPIPSSSPVVDTSQSLFWASHGNEHSLKKSDLTAFCALL